jgi:CHAT domain-containing protein
MSIKSEIGLTFPRLPLTSELGNSLKHLDPERTDGYTGMKAAKPVLFKNPLHGYGSMVFATHGYFGKDLPGIQEPVLVLTLVDQPEGKDGFLRMTEVMGLKMNAELVALTACQSGLGRRISGEGTMGMGRAFQYAGARSVLMSLWSVAEKSSVMLVESFFKHRKEGKSKLQALQMARKDIREAGYDHPFYWAPFILVGDTE